MKQPVVISWDEARKRVHERGFSLPFVGEQAGAEVLQLHLSSINPGEAAHPPHEHGGEEIMFFSYPAAVWQRSARTNTPWRRWPRSLRPRVPATACVTAAMCRSLIW